jgi:glycosyltransferase involved in cell wall biosynthesis
MKKKIVIVSGLQLCDNPRVVKEANTLSKAGYDVTVLSALISSSDIERNLTLARNAPFRSEHIFDVRSRTAISRGKWQFARIRRRIANTLHQLTGLESELQLGYFGPELMRHCLRINADLYSVHHCMAVAVGAKLSRLGRRVSIDVEDWHSEDLRTEERKLLPLRKLKAAEKITLRNGAFASTTSSALSDAISKVYECNKPIVLYNAFPLTERSVSGTPPYQRPISTNRLPRIGWISQVIGPDRGLEQLVEATHYLSRPVEIHLTGRLRPQMENTLRSRLHQSSRIIFQDQVPHENLLELMQSFDAGFAGEIAHNKNRDLTVTNKILHYFLAGIPAVCSDTQGQVEIYTQAPNACRIYKQYDPESLACAIDSLFSTPESLSFAMKEAWYAASTKFSWEAQEPRLLEAVRKAIG